MEFRVLGPLEVVEDGRAIPLERRRLRALLAFLLLHANEVVSSDRLIDEVWGPEPPKTAGASLQNYVSRLRKVIGADAIVSQPAGYVLRVDPERLDLARFERLVAEARDADTRERAEKLRAALALWRGPALDDLAYEPFARDAVGRLEEARVAALEERIAAELELGRDDLVNELEELVEEHPLRERFHAQLMRALYRAGRQADALAAFQSAREVLLEELGLEPGEELRTLQQAILRQDAALGPAAETTAERPPDRRVVTVLFCDLVGSSDLAARLDPEAYRAMLSRYFELVRAPIERHGGTTEKFIGDAVMAVFGVPELHEDDALRAVRAAVEAQAELRAEDVPARIGVSTGEVHVLSSPGEPLHVSGAPASVASRLEAAAPAGAVVVDADTYALVRDAVDAEPFGNAWRVDVLVPGAPAYARRLDAPLVGRRDELERLHAAYVDARDTGRCRVVTVMGEAGIGKTRLLRELLVPLREEARILVGRCASYGEGATYLPIAEIVRQAVREPSMAGVAVVVEGDPHAAQIARRVAELAGVAEGPPAPGEAFWAIRRFLEAFARERPVVVVLDDVHWAEPTLLDLVEYLGEWTNARVLVLCAARPELLEPRPQWGGPTSTGFVVELQPLGTDDVAQLVLNLTDEPLDAEVERRIVERAGGNPLFAEQLLATATEAPDTLHRTPPTLEALLASRLDRLETRELAVLRRASVIGRRFTREELGDLTPRSELARTEQHLRRLTQRALVHAREHVFAFHHVLVRDVAYRGIPKAERAELHELAAHGIDRRDGADEIGGYHYEQAFRAITDIAALDEHARRLADAGGERLGRAGIRAWQRADIPATENLLTRALALTPEAHGLACELAIALSLRGKRARALEVLEGVVERAEGDERLRAELEHGLLLVVENPAHARTLVESAERAVGILEASGDDRALGRAWYCIGFVRGGFYCEYAAQEEAAERIAVCYRRAGWPLSAALDMLGLALEFGPRHVDDAITRLEELSAGDVEGRWTSANVSVWLGRLESMRANFDVARAHVERAQGVWRDLGARAAAIDTSGRAAAAIELAAGNPDLAERSLRDACALLQETNERSVLATRAAELAIALYEQGKLEDASTWVGVARDCAGADDLDANLTRQPVEAKILARQGRVEQAEQLARATVELAGRTDSLNRRAESLLALAEVCVLAGAQREARAHVTAALEQYERKGNVAAAARARAKHEEPHSGLLVSDSHHV